MKNIRITLLLFVVLTVLTGLIYPLAMTLISQTWFPHQSRGSLLTDQTGKVVGSDLIGQNFSDPKYFWPRPSAVSYNPMPSGGSNLAISGKAFQKAMADRKEQFLSANPTAKVVPADMLQASGSGLDPHISVAAAEAQVDRIAKARHFSADQQQKIEDLIKQLKEGRTFNLLGEPRINVLKLNLALNTLK